MRNLLFQYSLTFLALFGGFYNIIKFKQTFYDHGQSDQKAAILMLGGFSIFFLGESLYYRLKWGRDSRYAKALTTINHAFSNLHQLEIGPDVKLNSIAEQMQTFCTNIASAFQIVTGMECSVCIKGIHLHKSHEGVPKAAVKTLFRDHISYTNRSPKDHNHNTVHFIENNSSYSRIFQRFKQPAKRYFISNNLPFFQGYKSTSFAYYGRPMKIRIPAYDHFLRNRRWPLTYKSTIVVPICGLHDTKHEELVGFLCLDSPYLGAFRKRFDLDLLLGIADGLKEKLLQFQNHQDAILSVAASTSPALLTNAPNQL